MGLLLKLGSVRRQFPGNILFLSWCKQTISIAVRWGTGLPIPGYSWLEIPIFSFPFLSNDCRLQPGGFTIEVTNNNSTMVMTGMRIQIGTQAIERAPSYLEIFGRTMQLNMTRSRWFDFPFTREEALQADKKLTIFSKSLVLVACFNYLQAKCGCLGAVPLQLLVGRGSTRN